MNKPTIRERISYWFFSPHAAGILIAAALTALMMLPYILQAAFRMLGN